MPRERVSDRVYEELRSAIASGELPDGSAHSIYGIAESRGISRTPVRDAVLRLAQDGMVVIARNQGFTVRGLGAEEIRELFDLRLLIEVPLAERAAEADRGRQDVERLRASLDLLASARTPGDFLAIDHDVHRVVAELAGNSAAADVLDGIRARTESRGANTLGRERSLAEVHAEHAAIADAITARDPRGAARAMRTHLESTRDLLLARLTSP